MARSSRGLRGWRRRSGCEIWHILCIKQHFFSLRAGEAQTPWPHHFNHWPILRKIERYTVTHMHVERGSASLYGGQVRGMPTLKLMTFFVSETLVFDASVIVFNKITILMTCMLPLMLLNELLKIHILCNNIR